MPYGRAAIVRHLCDSYGRHIIANRPKAARQLINGWNGRQAVLHAGHLPFLRYMRRCQRDSQIANLRDEAHEALTIVDRHLSDRAYLGDSFDGDIPLGCVVYRYFNVDIERPPLLMLSWYDVCTSQGLSEPRNASFWNQSEEWAALEKRVPLKV